MNEQTALSLQLDRDLCFFDLETTGGDVVNDRIIQIALIKMPKDGGEPIEKNYLINPTYPINPEAQAVHGYSNADLANEPTFKALAQEIFDFFADCDLVGYNSNRFDVPLLIEEFARVGLDFSTQNRRLIDVMQIFYKMEPRTLRAALKFYCGESLTNAHDAMADTRATLSVFWGQLRRYQNVDFEDAKGNILPRPIQPDNMQSIHDFVNDASRVDFTGRFIRNSQGQIIFNFGNNKGDVAAKHPNVLQWIIQRDFPLQVKNIAKAILDKQLV
jgi:DNA polymerase-3 subunit epsilon